MSDLVEVEISASIRRITLNRPQKVNALSTGMMSLLAKAIRDANPDRERLVVITGKGEKGFCSGADIGELQESKDQAAKQCQALREIADALANCTVPTLSLVHGRALGGGGMVACLSTIVLAEADTRIGFPEIQLGIFPAVVYAALLERLPPTLAFQLCASGRILDAREALDIGLVTEMLAPGSREERIDFYARQSAALAIGRRARILGPNMPLDERMEHSVSLLLDGLEQAGIFDIERRPHEN